MAEQIATVTADNFGALSLEVFRYQAATNPIYAQFINLLRIDPAEVRQPRDIPCLPISLFKRFALKSGHWEDAKVFTSSGTTGVTTSRHHLRDEDWYRQHARRTFEQAYGALADFRIFALLPAYLERTGSSLVFMADDFIRQSKGGGFYLDDLARLQTDLNEALQAGERVLLLGVSFALLDLAEQLQRLPGGHLIVMETGGMKGRRRELTRPELHRTLLHAFGTGSIHSEYGMTELLSQAYSKGEGIFQPAPTLAAFSRDTSDPLCLRNDSRTGALNLHDLANLDTISFIATDDLGKVYSDGSFEVLGRMDASDTRGCNLLVG